MSIGIQPITAVDGHTSFSVGERAFHAITPILFHTLPLSEESKARITQARVANFGKNPNTHGFKAVDTENGQLVGFALWIVYPEDDVLSLSVEEEARGKLGTEVPERRVECSLAYYAMIAGGKREALGVEKDKKGEVVKLRKRVELGTLFVDPEYQRRGIARQLLKFGFEEAERLGLEMTLEATREGKRLYESLGFETVKVEQFDARPFGADIVDDITFMVRPVGAKKGLQ
ncbi:acyl-CoA N-acyltransferase [Aspergillus crustosus]